MLSKIPEEIFCGVFYSPPVLLEAFPQPPSFTSYGDQTLEWSKIHLTMVCLIESTNTCENGVIISTKEKAKKNRNPLSLLVKTKHFHPRFLGVQKISMNAGTLAISILSFAMKMSIHWTLCVLFFQKLFQSAFLHFICTCK